jgi:hypothetical protein
MPKEVCDRCVIDYMTIQSPSFMETVVYFGPHTTGRHSSSISMTLSYTGSEEHERITLSHR